MVDAAVRACPGAASRAGIAKRAGRHRAAALEVDAALWALSGVASRATIAKLARRHRAAALEVCDPVFAA